MARTIDPGSAGPISMTDASEAVRSIAIAFIGAPYVGKTTIFNLLAGLSQRVRLWPGTSVEIRSGRHQYGARAVEITDLPQVYSLGSNSADERVAREFILSERPDALVVVLNAANLEHTLYLVSEALELPCPVVIALNMMDVAARNGIVVEPEVLQAALGIPVIAMSASRQEGFDEMLRVVVELVDRGAPYVPRRPEFDPQLRGLVEQIAFLAGDGSNSPAGRWVSLKLLEGDREVTRIVEEAAPQDRWDRLQSLLRDNEDAVVRIAGARYEWIERMVRAAVVKPQHGQVSLTERVDRIATHPVLGAVMLLATLGLLFSAVYTVAGPVVSLLDRAVTGSGLWLHGALSGGPPWLTGLLVDGVLDGVGTVVSLLPYLALFFLGMGVLQQVGYLARAAFVGDRLMHLIGLHGQSLVPLFLGFGCNVPAVLGARMVDSARARLLTVLLIPLVPCTSRTAVLVFVAGALFGSGASLVAWSLVTLNLVLLILVGIATTRWVMRGEEPALIMEMPLYHMPNWRVVGLQAWQNVREFLTRAGTVILLVSIVIWVLSAQPSGSIQDSYLAWAGRYLEPLGGLMGLDWRMMVALLTSFVAKENALAAMAVLAGSGEGSNLTAALPQMLTPAAALAYLVLQITFIPCASTLSAIRHQTRSWRWTAFTLGYLLVLSLTLGILTYQLALLLGI